MPPVRFTPTKRGCPPNPNAIRRVGKTALRLKPELQLRVAQHATREGLSVNDWIRRCIEVYLDDVRKP